MKTITVNTAKAYPVIIGDNLFSGLDQYLSKLHTPCTTAIISDSNVWPVYGNIVSSAAEAAGFRVISYNFPAGEGSKNIQTYSKILEFLAQNHLTRSDLIIALGGGVTGDIAGFAAATYLRGIPYIQIPTSLLAMVDSSVGGKTAIDLPMGKNLVGAFYQPLAVLCDIQALQTLPKPIFRDGCAEVIKYGILYDHTLFDHLAKKGLDFDKEYVISRCVELKRDVVCLDEFDTGARQMLNLGHTFGHGIEAQSRFTVSHGQAVSIGMAVAARAAEALGLCPNADAQRITQVLAHFGLPTHTNYSAEAIYTAALSDKKRSGATVNLILPHCVGSCAIHPTAVEELQTIIKVGL